MDALASAACFNTVRRVMLDLAIVFLPVTCLDGDATIYTITGAPHSGAPSRFIDCSRHRPEGAERQVVASAAVSRDPRKREPDRPLLAKNPARGRRAAGRRWGGGLC